MMVIVVVGCIVGHDHGNDVTDGHSYGGNGHGNDGSSHGSDGSSHGSDGRSHGSDGCSHNGSHGRVRCPWII